MLDLKRYNSVGEALRDALETWPTEVCLIESDRGEEKQRLTYCNFKDKALPLAKSLQDLSIGPGDRVAIIMTNQSKWLISAYAIFFCGATLVPLDFKLKPEEQWQLLKHSGAKVLITEYGIWRQLCGSPARSAAANLVAVLATEAPENADMAGAGRWENVKGADAPVFVPQKRQDIACIVYSSGTGGTPKGCMMTHENYLEQCIALTALFPFWPGVRYLSILPTNHAIDFMVGFIGPFTCGAAVVHLRTLRPEYIRDAFTRYKITYMSLVPMVLKNLEKGLRQRFAELPAGGRTILNALIATNRTLTRGRPNLKLSRALLGQVHEAFGGALRALFVGGAFTEPATLQFFYDLGIQVGNGYGCTEAGTAITLNDFRPFRADTVGKPLPGMEVKIVNPNSEGIGEVAVRSKTLMSHYLDDPEMAAETIVNGWLIPGDLGRIDAAGHLQLFGRKKNMIVTEEGKNIYPEDIENNFEGIAAKEFCVFAANFLWPERTMVGEKLVLAIHHEAGAAVTNDVVAEIAERNRRLLNYKRISGYLVWDRDFPLTASLKIKRGELAEKIRGSLERSAMVVL